MLRFEFIFMKYLLNIADSFFFLILHFIFMHGVLQFLNRECLKAENEGSLDGIHKIFTSCLKFL